jgi:hypothetical protein
VAATAELALEVSRVVSAERQLSLRSTRRRQSNAARLRKTAMIGMAKGKFRREAERTAGGLKKKDSRREFSVQH